MACRFFLNGLLGGNMEKKKFEKLLKEKTPKQLIFMHHSWQITLTSKQLDKVIRLKNAEAK